MDIEKFEGDIKKIVENILEKQATAGIEKDVQDALKEAETTIKRLRDKVVEVNSRVTEDAAAIEALKTEKTELETAAELKATELEKLAEEIKVLTERAENAEKVINDLETDKLEAARMAELESVKVVRNGEARDKQAQLVRSMTDEEFSSYKEEMVSLRNELVASIKTELESAGQKVEEIVSPVVAEVVAEVSPQTPPANVEGALSETAAVMPNVQNEEGAQWKNFSNGLAALMKEKRSEVTKVTR